MPQFDHRKYPPYPPINKTDRRWPDQQISHAPIWCSVDLRDGNQALVEPMDVAQKTRLFNLLVEIGFKEIEIGFPAASQTEYDFARHLIDHQLIPEDVTVQVLTQAREPLIAKTFEALKGVRRAIVHVYNSTSTVQRQYVFRKNKDSILQLAAQGAQWVQDYAAEYPDTQWQFQYSPESFTGTELDYAVAVCDAVTAIWQPTPDCPAIINLPATVEMTTPNIFADQIEWVCDHIARREALIISLHTHNDRGCAVAAAELGLLAGADRLEGTLLGNGERTGNMDIITAALNLYSRGIDPSLDFSQMDQIIHTVESCTQMKTPPRHPYAGELVFTAFSGSHQDAINKCLDRHSPADQWEIPYLPIDPRDLGRTYQEVIRINSQSGKGGVAYILRQQAQLKVPRWLQVDFSPYIQRQTEIVGGELAPDQIIQLFRETYGMTPNALQIDGYTLSNREEQDVLSVRIRQGKTIHEIRGRGKGALDAFINAINTDSGISAVIIEYDEHTLGSTEEADAIAYVQININGQRYCAIGQHSDVLKASFQAVLNGLARAHIQKTALAV